MSTTTKPELHQSMLGLLSKCGMQAYYRYVEGIRSPPGVAAHVGTGCHKSVRANLANKRDHGVPLPAEAVGQAAAEGFEIAWELAPPLMGEDEKALGEAAVKGEAKDQAVQLALVHALDVAPQITPLKLEHKIILELPGAPFDLGGTIDIVERRPSGELAVRDTKTSGKRPTRGTAARSVQLQLYGWMYEQATKEKPVVGTLDTIVKTKKPYADIDETPMPTDYSHLFLRLEAAAKVFETGAFMPVDPTGPDSWVCSPRWCGYWDRCPYGARAQVQVH